MTRVILIGPGAGKTALAMAHLREQYGNDVEVYTPEEAQEKGLKPEDFANIPTYKIEPLPSLPDMTHYIKGHPKKSKKRSNNIHNPRK